MGLLVACFPELKDALQNQLLTPTLFLAFYSNDVTPGLDNVYGDFTIAVDPVTSLPVQWELLSANWTYSETSSGCLAVQPQIAAIVNGPFTTYGYFVFDGPLTLKWAQRWDGAPITFASGAQAVIFTPQINANSPD